MTILKETKKQQKEAWACPKCEKWRDSECEKHIEWKWSQVKFIVHTWGLQLGIGKFT
jgi:ubiquitin C-terminal hydrolase